VVRVVVGTSFPNAAAAPLLLPLLLLSPVTLALLRAGLLLLLLGLVLAAVSWPGRPLVGLLLLLVWVASWCCCWRWMRGSLRVDCTCDGQTYGYGYAYI
jgi:asparagine N-glycosylation enzyme membrane subunit Stt3